MKKYNHKNIESKWQKEWEKSGLYKTTEDPKKPKSYVLDMFPYPSGEGLHVGHPKGYIATDIYSRYKKMTGHNVLHPMGWDAFGLPAENYALKNKVHPRIAVEKNIKRFKEQLGKIGFNYDWEREINTTDSEYYKWTQWTFLQMFKKGLAYESNEPINWCPSCKTGLANEDLDGDRCERCGTIVEQKPIRQWVLKITDYADRMLEDLNELDWPKSIKESQRNWIGRSDGAEIRFSILNSQSSNNRQLQNKEKFIGIGVFLETVDGKFLLQKRDNNTDINPNKIAPFGGGIDSKDINIKQTAIRELKEELNLSVSESDLDVMGDFQSHKVKDGYIRMFIVRGVEKHKLSLMEGEAIVSLSMEEIFSNKEVTDFTKEVFSDFQDTKELEVFTTRPDTLFGATYCVLAPEHELVGELKSQIENWNEVEKYRDEVAKKTEIERTAEGKEKTGVELKGVKVINPANGEELPIFIADYVLAHYGTGAIMAVPAHDERDFEFAKKFGLPIKEVVAPSFVLSGDNAPRKDFKTLDRSTVSAVIESTNGGEFLLIKEKENTILVGGGIEENESSKEAILREIREETGYINVEIKDVIFENLFCCGFRHTKQKNQKTKDVFYHVQLKDDERVESEVEAGRHKIIWLKRDEISENISCEHHKFVWSSFVDEGAFTEKGVTVNSGKFDGMDSEKAKKAITEFVGGKMKTTYKLRDWVFSRQRYWGEPIPIIHCEKCGAVPVPESELPVELPDVKSYEPTGTGESPLAGIDEWVNVECPKCGGVGKRETNTMPQWAGSSWYYLRYIDPQNDNVLVDKKKEKYWSPVDMYVGGAEHATRHLVYARFWHKFLYDIGVVNYKEPFKRLQHVGLINAEDGRKMSKRDGNVVNPDEIVEMYGADTLRVYEMFMGPFDQGVQWSTDSIMGPRRFLEKVWRLQEKISEKGDAVIETTLHKTIKKAGEDIESFDFNTAISQMMILVNEAEKAESITNKDFEILLKLLAPFAPHITEELWQEVLGNKTSIHLESWPEYKPEKIKEERVTIVVQVNGKVRGEFEIDIEDNEETVKERALSLENIQKWTEGEDIKKIIYVENKLINIVV